MSDEQAGKTVVGVIVRRSMRDDQVRLVRADQPNDGEALVYYHIADNMGHPLAHEYLRGLDQTVRSAQ